MNSRKLIYLTITIIIIMCTNLLAQDWANLNRFKSANSLLLSQPYEKDRIVFMGNSITQSWIDKRPEFFSNNPFVNRGISGQTTPQMLIRFRQDVIELKPKAVVILAGTNDIAGNTGPSSPEMIMDNLKSMTEIAIANNIQVILSSVLPVYEYPWSAGKEPNIKIPKLNEMIKEFCNEKNIIYLDYFSAMVDDRNGLPEKFAHDGVHPNDDGYKVMEPLVLKAIKKLN